MAASLREHLLWIIIFFFCYIISSRWWTRLTSIPCHVKLLIMFVFLLTLKPCSAKELIKHATLVMLCFPLSFPQFISPSVSEKAGKSLLTFNHLYHETNQEIWHYLSSSVIVIYLPPHALLSIYANLFGILTLFISARLAFPIFSLCHHLKPSLLIRCNENIKFHSLDI